MNNRVFNIKQICCKRNHLKQLQNWLNYQVQMLFSKYNVSLYINLTQHIMEKLIKVIKNKASGYYSLLSFKLILDSGKMEKQMERV